MLQMSVAKWTKWNARDTAKNKYEDESLADCRSRFSASSFVQGYTVLAMFANSGTLPFRIDS